MTKDKKAYTLAYFKEENQDLIISKINRLYLAFFDYECAHIKESYLNCSSDISYESMPSSLLDLYKKFERNITTIWGELSYVYDHIEKNKSKLCIYLKYWLYDQLIERRVDQADFTNFFNLWNKQKEEKCSVCECEFSIEKLSEIKQIKKIYDFFLYWDSYKDKNEMKNVISKKEYCNYINDSKILYSLKKITCEGKNDKFCNEINKYIIPNLKIDENFIITCNTEEESYADLHNAQDLQHSHEQNSQNVTDSLVPDSSNDGKSTGTIISASSVGTVGFLYLLYKFTPLRSMLDPLIKKTKKNLMNGVQGSNELQSQDYDFNSPDMHFNRYNIGYQFT